MKVFISWSGDTSKQVAIALRDWMSTMIQRLHPWMSDRDIPSGSFWNNEIVGHLDDAGFGVACVTADNRESTWLHFEAGAMAVKLKGKTCPYILGVAPEELKGPLGQLHGNPANRAGTEKLMRDINAELGVDALGEKAFEKAFRTHWKALEKKLDAIEIVPPATAESVETVSGDDVEVGEISDGDAKVALVGWLRGLDDTAIRQPMKYADVDRSLRLPAGTTKRLLPQAASETSLKVEGGDERFLLKADYSGFVVSDARSQFDRGGY